jgi:hypothetical protein
VRFFVQRPPRAGEPLAFVDTRIPQKSSNRNGIIPGRAVFFAVLSQKDVLSYTGTCTFLLSCTDYSLNVRKKHIKRTIFMQKPLTKPAEIGTV